MNWQAVLHDLSSELTPKGLDLTAATRIEVANRAVPDELAISPLDTPADLVVVVGNSRALWPRFLEWLDQDPRRGTVPDPLDSYVEAAISDAVERLSLAASIRYAHEPPPRRIAIQRLAEVAGLAHIAPTHLCIHPVFGPWISLRAAIILAVPGPDPPAAPPDPCRGCTTECHAALAHALKASATVGPRSAWQAWVAVRDACRVGRDHRFSDDQLRYHGLGDRRAFRSGR